VAKDSKQRFDNDTKDQRPSSNDRDQNVYFAFLLMRQRQDTILIMLESVTHVLEHARKKEGTRSHTFVLMESVDRK